jgi:ATP-binding cassette subfamily F protein 3
MTDAKVGYSKDTPILLNVNVDVDMDTRVAFVGPNGAGKSTLLNTLIGKLQVLDGKAFAHGKCSVGVFTQHHMEMLDPRLSALEQFHRKWPKDKSE